MKKLCLVHDWEYRTSDGYGNVIWYGDDRDCRAQCRKCFKWNNFKGGHRFETLPGGDLKRCTRCGREFSTAPKPLSLEQALDKLAHFHTFSTDRTEEAQLTERILEFGENAWKNIVGYLSDCAMGVKSDGWWYNAPYLVRLIARFPEAPLDEVYEYLADKTSNRAEYQTCIRDVAKEELAKLKASQSGA